MTLTRIYLLLMLSTAALSAPLPYALTAALLLLVNLWFLFVRQGVLHIITITLLSYFLLPLLLEPVASTLLSAPSAPTATLSVLSHPFGWPEVLSAVLTLPLLILLSKALEENIRTGPLPDSSRPRFFGPTVPVLFIICLAILFLALFLENSVLMLSPVLLSFYLAVRLAYAWSLMAGRSVSIVGLNHRMLAGKSANLNMFIKNARLSKLYGALQTEENWIKLPARFLEITGKYTKFPIALSPQLAGPFRPDFRLTLCDPLGLLYQRYTLNPLRVEVIPRSQYAKVLAKRFLAASGSGTMPSSFLNLFASLRRSRGTEYVSSRDYQPGDHLKDIDYKHSLKLNKLISKDFSGVSGQTIALLANLTVPDALAADRLAYKLIGAALTLAYHGLPYLLGLYNRDGIIELTAGTNPPAALQHVLTLVNKIDIRPSSPRRLVVPQIAQLRHNLHVLQQSSSPTAAALRELFEFQYASMQHGADLLPITIAVRRIIARIKPPALIMLVSSPGDDSEALSVVVDRFQRSQYEVVDLSVLNY